MKASLISVLVVAACLLATEARAARASVAVAKAAVAAAKATGRASVAVVKAAPKACPWHGLIWIAKHV